MPYTLDWHVEKQMLVIEYQEQLTLTEYQQLRTERAAAIDEGPDGIIICADMRTFDMFSETFKNSAIDHLLQHPKVRGIVIVLAQVTYRQLSRAIVEDYEQHLPLYFVSSMEDAAQAAAHLLA